MTTTSVVNESQEPEQISKRFDRSLRNEISAILLRIRFLDPEIDFGFTTEMINKEVVNRIGNAMWRTPGASSWVKGRLEGQIRYQPDEFTKDAIRGLLTDLFGELE